MKDSLVIIPTYNEKENVELILKAVFSLAHPFDILVVDDNSPDGTADIVRHIQGNLADTAMQNRLHLIQREGKQGLGTAYIKGFEFALEKDYEYIFEMDADFSHSPQDLLSLYRTCATDQYDMAVGSRYISGVNVVNWPLGRVMISYFASFYVRFITGIKIKDSTAGFVCYKRKVLETIRLDKIRFIGYAFQIEMKFWTVKLGFKVKEVPIIFTDRIRGKSKMSISIFQEAFFGVISMQLTSLFKPSYMKK
ncbi:MAG: polyprenol monophosphomannose synthase [Cyclobacteriaceae bacterium]|nr:polyprenol monophosphomannose synthase [Cyclobacteriaceae bacterium]